MRAAFHKNLIIARLCVDIYKFSVQELQLNEAKTPYYEGIQSINTNIQ